MDRFLQQRLSRLGIRIKGAVRPPLLRKTTAYSLTSASIAKDLPAILGWALKPMLYLNLLNIDYYRLPRFTLPV